MWCVIPDWISTADNTGSVTVSLTGGDRDASLALDARDNAVAFDGLEGPVVWARPAAESLEVLTTGDLGRPELRPTGARHVPRGGEPAAAGAGAGRRRHLRPVATDFQVLVAVVDWLNRDDNTGTTRLERGCTTRASSCGGEVSGSLWLSDCASPFPVQEVGERILVAGEAGQVVTVTGTSEGYFFRLALFDPSGTAIAVSNYAGRDRAEIADVTLPVPGTYVLWALDEPYEGPLAYTVRIDCSGP